MKWDKNTDYLVKKANARMELLRKVASFGTSVDEKKNIYILYTRSILETPACQQSRKVEVSNPE